MSSSDSRMDKKEGKVLLGKYQLGKVLGRGSFAKVYQATHLKTNQIVAIKAINKEMIIKSGLFVQTKREITIMKRLKHPNIVQLYEVMATKEYIYLVMEYAEGGELVQKIKKGGLKEESARRYFQQLITTVDFCHKRGVIHRDLKPENLLLDKDGVLKVSDFGLSALIAESKMKEVMLHTTCGTLTHVAPEIIYRLKPDEGYDGAKADIWSCGVILFTLLAGNCPFSDPNTRNLYRKIHDAEYRCPKWFSIHVKTLLLGILNPNPAQRLSASDIMRCSWFQEGLNSKTMTEVEDPESDDCDQISEDQEETITPATLSAFDIISLSNGFDLSGLMLQKDAKNSAVQFTSTHSATSIMSKLRDMTRKLKLKSKKEGASLKVMKGQLSIEAEIFEVTPSFHFVEMKKSNGDTFEFKKMVDEDIRPALKDVVWAWQGEHSNNNSSICV